MAAVLPPRRLIERVGWVVGDEDSRGVFDARGREQWQLVASLAEPYIDLSSARVLDFGCGVGRMLRPAVEALPSARFTACDIDEASVRWLKANVGGRARVFQSSEWPPLDAADGQFDLIYAFSVFTHLTQSWSAWLLELHRVLAPNGLVIATVVGPGLSRHGVEPVSEDIIGMNILYPAASWDTGGPLILHSEWWLRAHWGRAFEILHLQPGDPSGAAPLYGQGVIVMRRRPVSPELADLERPEPSEEREFVALRQNVQSLQREVIRHAAVYDTHSWKLTAPLRDGANKARAFLRRKS